MRLIDADAVISFVDAGHLRNPSALSWSDKDVVDMIEARPTIEVAPVEGRWQLGVNTEAWVTFDECKCSVCGVVEYFNKGWKKFNYCPNCGAKMDGGKE